MRAMCSCSSRSRASWAFSQAARSSGVLKIFLFLFTVLVLQQPDDVPDVGVQIGERSHDGQNLAAVDALLLVQAFSVPASASARKTAESADPHSFRGAK